MNMDDQVKKDMAASYQNLLEQWAFKDLMRELKEKVENDQNELDNKAPNEFNNAIYFENKGFRKAKKWIENHIDFIIQGGG